jgi:uncharacterized OB-fold protein
MGKKKVIKEKCKKCGHKFFPEQMSKDREGLCKHCAFSDFLDVAFGPEITDVQQEKKG